jgi:hypothetical protein
MTIDLKLCPTSTLLDLCSANTGYWQSQSHLMTDSQLASLPCWWDHHLRTVNSFSFLLHENSLYTAASFLLWGALSGEMGLYSCCRASQAQSFLGLNTAGLNNYISLPQFWDSYNFEGQVPIFISSKKRVAQLQPQGLSTTLLIVSSIYNSGAVTRDHHLPPLLCTVYYAVSYQLPHAVKSSWARNASAFLLPSKGHFTIPA